MSEQRPGVMVTAAEAARIKGVSRQAIYKAITDGRLKATRSGRAWLIARTALDRWLPARDRPTEHKENQTMTELQEKLSDIHAQAERMAQRVHEVFDRAGGQMTMEDLVEALGEEEDLMIDGVPSELFSDFLRPGGSLESAIFNAMIHPAAKGAGWYAIPANVVSGPYWKRADLCDRYEITAFLIEMRYATGLWRPEMDAFLDQAAARFPEHATEFRAMVAEFKAAEKERDRLERSSWLKED